MIRSLLAIAASVAMVSLASFAADDKAKKKDEAKPIEGMLVCTKCTLKETDKCGHALKVKEKDKDVVYYIDDKGAKESYHKGVCPADSEAKAKVSGKVEEKEGKKWIKEAKVEIVK
jgi:hypothetical protein